VTESVRRITTFKKKAAGLKRRVPPPTVESVARMARHIWEFSEQVRLEGLARQEPA
jgi:hypothetical protein